MHQRFRLRPTGLTWLTFMLLVSPLDARGADEVGLPPSDVAACERMLDEHAQGIPGPFDPAKRSVVLVDGYSSGRLLARAFREAGLQVLHVHATGGVPRNFTDAFWPRTFEKSIAFDGNLDGLIQDLRAINVVAVLPGADTGVFLADRIATALQHVGSPVPSNGIERGRKDKYEMQERIRARGLDSVRQIMTANVEESLRWIREHGLLGETTASVVVKPLLSAGGEGVFFPESEADVRQHFRDLLEHEDGLGNRNNQLLTQEKIRGTEYVLNSTVWRGRLVYTDIWMYHKRKTATGRWIYDYDVLLPWEGELQSRLREYDQKVVGALGIAYGNSHSEIMMVPGRGPVLIESNNRPMGALQPAFAKFATGRSQIDLTALAITDPAAFENLPETYSIRKNAIVFTIANLYGRDMRLKPEVRERLRRLPGYFRDALGVEPGVVTPPTEDMFSQIGEVWLLHEDMNVLMRTVDELHVMETNGALFSAP